MIQKQKIRRRIYKTRFLPSHLEETDQLKKEHDLRQELQSILDQLNTTTTSTTTQNPLPTAVSCAIFKKYEKMYIIPRYSDFWVRGEPHYWRNRTNWALI